LCGIQNRLPPRNAADFLELAEICTFLDRKLISALCKTADGHYLNPVIKNNKLLLYSLNQKVTPSIENAVFKSG
jgi:hypothetical protein